MSETKVLTDLVEIAVDLVLEYKEQHGEAGMLWEAWLSRAQHNVPQLVAGVQKVRRLKPAAAPGAAPEER